MIDLYTWPTPNGRKVSIMLEETGLPYTVHPVDIRKGEQYDPGFLSVSPGNKIPAIVDREDGISLMESGAILIYLAEKTGRFLSTDRRTRFKTLEWLMYQMGGVGPMLGQAHHFLRFNPDVSPYASDRYSAEAHKIYGVLDRRLAEVTCLGGDDYSIADIATWPWVSRYEWHQVDLERYPAVLRWYVDIAARPAVKKGYHVPHRVNDLPMP
jgi:GST-like protein